MTLLKISSILNIGLAALAMALLLTPGAHAAAITATAIGDVNPPLATHPGFVINGDFLIFGSAEAPLAGDGIDDYTVWHFHFQTDPGYSSFDFSVPLTSAWMTVTLTPKNQFVLNDQFWIEEMYDRPVHTAEMESLPLDAATTLQFQLLDFYSPTELTGLLMTYSGELPMRYLDDAVISYASLTFANDAAAIPEPSTWALLSGGVLFLAVGRRIAAR
jgi:hypothetical protein